jgi:hypothetical protein
VSVVILTQLVQLEPPLDFPLALCLYCFAVSLPLTASHLFLLTWLIDYHFEVPRWAGAKLHGTLMGMSVYAFFLGLVYFFVHFSLMAAVTFLIVSWIGYAFGVAYIFTQSGMSGSFSSGMAYSTVVVILIVASAAFIYFLPTIVQRLLP